MVPHAAQVVPLIRDEHDVFSGSSLNLSRYTDAMHVGKPDSPLLREMR